MDERAAPLAAAEFAGRRACWLALGKGYIGKMKLGKKLFLMGGVVGLGATGYVAYQYKARPWMKSWGATAAEVRAAMPGDDIVKGDGQTTRAITISAPVAEVWPWLVQMGYKRAGFYTYDEVENAVKGLTGKNPEFHSADRIVPEWQNLKAGDLLPIGPQGGWRVVMLVPNRSLVVKSAENTFSWAITLSQVDAKTTRVITRMRFAPEPELPRRLKEAALEPWRFIMESGMLEGLKARAEANHQG